MGRRPLAYRFEYADGLKATMLLLNGLVRDFTFAARLRGQGEPLSTLFYFPPTPNVTYSAALMSRVEEMFLTDKPVYPVQADAFDHGAGGGRHEIAGTGQQRLATPHLAIRYQAPAQSTFSHD